MVVGFSAFSIPIDAVCTALQRLQGSIALIVLLNLTAPCEMVWFFSLMDEELGLREIITGPIYQHKWQCKNLEIQVKWIESETEGPFLIYVERLHYLQQQQTEHPVSTWPCARYSECLTP